MTIVEQPARIEVLTLELQGETFAIDAAYVQEILDMVAVTEVPNSQPFVNGLINVRGKVVPYADLRIKFEMELAPPTIDTRIIVVDVDLDGVPTTVGLRADKVYEVTELGEAALTETPRIGMRWRPEYIRCIGRQQDDFIIVLDLSTILATGLTDRTGDDSSSSNIAAV